MKFQQVMQRVTELTKLAAQFLVKTFSDKKNIVRYSLTVVALVVVAQLLPFGKIEYAGLGMTFFVVLSYIGMMISAPYALKKIKINSSPINLTAFYMVAGTVLLLVYDWLFWYFEIAGLLWVLLYCVLVAVFNGIIENLLNDEHH